ncbi:MAG: DUF1844 domain-containing protein [Bryobacteraceae bacterium]|jgi:hypothetical protein
MSEETPHTEQQETPSAERHELPPASFGELIFSLRFQAEMHLGLVPLDEDEKPPIDLAAAQHYIDLLGILAGKTRGNLEIEEQRYLENSLTELRFRYVQAAGQVQIK